MTNSQDSQNFFFVFDTNGVLKFQTTTNLGKCNQIEHCTIVFFAPLHHNNGYVFMIMITCVFLIAWFLCVELNPRIEDINFYFIW